MLKLQRKPIHTQRLLLLPYTMKYSASVFNLISKNKESLVQSFPKMLAATETLLQTKDYVQHKIFDWNKNIAFCFHILCDDELIGHINIKDIKWRSLEAELSYFIDQDYQQKGFALEALNEVLKVCFTALKLRHVYVRIVTTNLPSTKLAEKAGLQYEGSFARDYITYDKKVVDTYRYGITCHDYQRNYLHAL